MINKRKQSFPKVKTIELNIKDFSKGLNLNDAENVCDMNYYINCYNFDFKSGALIEGLGFEDAGLPITVEYGCGESLPEKSDDYDYLETWYYKHYSHAQGKRVDKLMLRLSSNLIYYIRLFSRYSFFYTINQLTYNEKPFTKNVRVCGIDGIIMSSEKDGVYSWDGESVPVQRPDCPIFVDLCEHKNKMYAILAGEQNFIRVSSNMEVVDWTNELGEGDFDIELNDKRGPINKLVSCFGYLFCIRDYGITKLTTYENSNQINVSHVHSSGSKIFSKTVCDCGNKIIMLTRNGLYEFNGSSCEKINTNLNQLLEQITSDYAMATYRAGIYYIAGRINFNDGKTIGCENTDGYINNVLIAYNVNDNTYTITRGVDILDLSTIQSSSMDKVLVCFKTVYNKHLGQFAKNGKFFTDVVHKYWCSPLSDLGYSNKIKYVKQISLLSKYDCDLTIFTEKESKTFKVKGKNVLSKFLTNLKGKQIGIKIETDEQYAYISNMKIKIDLLDNIKG